MEQLNDPKIINAEIAFEEQGKVSNKSDTQGRTFISEQAEALRGVIYL